MMKKNNNLNLGILKIKKFKKLNKNREFWI